MYSCDQCSKTYKYRRNLKRHVMERHKSTGHWQCVVSECASSFIRRSYLKEHLIRIHKFSQQDARQHAISARRVVENRQDSYYEDVSSSDDDILDLLAEDCETSDVDRNICIQTFDTDNYGYDNVEDEERVVTLNVNVIETVNVNESADDVDIPNLDEEPNFVFGDDLEYSDISVDFQEEDVRDVNVVSDVIVNDNGSTTNEDASVVLEERSTMSTAQETA